MKITIESTTRVTELEVGDAKVMGRVWEGTTESGIPVFCVITRIAAPKEADLTQFERELLEQKAPSVRATEAIPLRFII